MLDEPARNTRVFPRVGQLYGVLGKSNDGIGIIDFSKTKIRVVNKIQLRCAVNVAKRLPEIEKSELGHHASRELTSHLSSCFRLPLALDPRPLKVYVCQLRLQFSLSAGIGGVWEGI